MPSQQNGSHPVHNTGLPVYSGTFETISLTYEPEFPPKEPAEISEHTIPTYPHELAYVHVFLDGQDASEQLPSAYGMLLLNGLLSAINKLYAGQEAIAWWVADPWQFELHSDLEANQVIITLRTSNKKWVAIQEARAPLDQFALSVVQLAQEWEQYLLTHYADEMFNERKRGDYQRFRHYLERAEEVLRANGLL